MLWTATKRLFWMFPVLFLVTLSAFLLMEFVPGDPAVAILGTSGSPEQYEMIRDELGLERPVIERYTEWLTDTVQGDLGKTLVPPVRDVTDLITSRFVITLQIAFMAMVVAVAVSILLGTVAAMKPGKAADQVISATTVGLVSLPSFLAALLLIYAFVLNRNTTRLIVLVAGLLIALAIGWQGMRREKGRDRRSASWHSLGLAALVAIIAILCFWLWPEFPRQGFVRFTDSRGVSANLRSAFLPVLAVAGTEIAVFTTLLRSDLRSTLQEDFVLAARARGLPRWHIMLREALRPSTFSLITVAGVSFGRLLGGTVIVETIFGIPGVGTLIVDAIYANDYRVVQGGILVIAVFYVIVNTIVDIAYLYLDPRVRRA